MDDTLRQYLLWKGHQWADAQRAATGAWSRSDVAGLAKAYVQAHYVGRRDDLIQEIQQDAASTWSELCNGIQTASDDGVLSLVTDVLGLVDAEVGTIGELVADGLLLACSGRSRWGARNGGLVGVGVAVSLVAIGIGLLFGGGGGSSA